MAIICNFSIHLITSAYTMYMQVCEQDHCIDEILFQGAGEDDDELQYAKVVHVHKSRPHPHIYG